MKHNKPSAKLEQIGYDIASFYLNKNKNDYVAAEKEVISLNITDIQIDPYNSKLRIFTARPGLLVGRKGENLDNLSKHLKREIEIVEAFHWNEVLVPFDYSEC